LLDRCMFGKKSNIDLGRDLDESMPRWMPGGWRLG
jgi:hypothetical protein